MKQTLFLAGTRVISLLLTNMTPPTQPAAIPLTVRQQARTTISAYTTTGSQPRLREALTQGLQARLTVHEEKEVLVHLYAYCGFPRSLSGIKTP